MDSTLRFEEVDQFLADPDPTVRLRTLNILQEQWPSELLAHHQEKVTPLVADPRREVSSKALSLLQELMPSDRILQHLHTFFPWLKSADPWVKTSTQRLFEKKISRDVLSQHFQKIVPVLLADPQLQLWSFGLLRGKVSSEQLTGHLDLIMHHMAHQDWGVKRRTLEFIQEEMPREMGADQCQQIAKLLVHDDWEVRRWTLALLKERLPSELLAQLGEKVIGLAGDPRLEVQQQAVELLEKKMPTELIIKHFQNLLARLQQADPRIRKSSLRLFEKRISKAVLAEHFEKLVPPLLSDPELQVWALKFLKGRVSPKHLPELIDLIMLHLVSHKTWKKQKALELMKVHLPDELRACHIERIEKLLVDTDCKVRIWMLELLHQRMPGELLVQHWKTLWPLLDDESHKVQMAAAKLFIEKGSGLRREHVAEHCEQFAALLAKTGQIEKLESAFHDILSPSPTKDKVARLLSKLPVSSFVAQHMEQIASWQDQSGNTWLHLAAAEGHLEACKALVDTAGLALRALNDAHEEPLSLAATREVDRFLRSRMHFQETRFGHGNAYHDMAKDERWVSEVVWYTVPLPGMAGQLGGMHSFLVITVSDADLAAAKRYVLEKAGSAAREAHQKNGVFVGTQGLETNLRSVPGFQDRKMLSLAKGNLQKELKVRKLYSEAHCTGQYDLASSNCHHAAQRVFNFCCVRHEDREVEPPNSWLAKLGATFQLTGLFNSSHSSSEGSGSRVGSAESQVASTSRPVDTPSGFTTAVDLRSDAFSEIAAALSHAVYEEETSGLFKPLEAEIAVIHNKLGKAVVVYDQATGSRHRVDPDERKSISIPKERATVDVYAVAWVPGLYTHRVLARKQPIWGGHIYSLTMDFRSVVVLQEVMPCACVSKVDIDILHATWKQTSQSPVQWLLARSGTAIFASFRGTDDVQDAAIDLSAVPDTVRFKEHCIGVHGGMAHALEQDGDEVGNVVNDVLGALKQHHRVGEQLVLCGHSLGGGYAQIMALHLLSRKLSVSAVRTFGAPHVLVPPKNRSSQMWQKLHAITQHWVHDWDPVPRLPLCQDWLLGVLPKLKHEVTEGVRIGIAQKYIAGLHQSCNGTRARLLEKYDVVGQLMLVSLTSSVAYRASEGAPLKKLLSEKPPEPVMTLSKLPAYHSMQDYFQIAQKLTTV